MNRYSVKVELEIEAPNVLDLNDILTMCILPIPGVKFYGWSAQNKNYVKKGNVIRLGGISVRR